MDHDIKDKDIKDNDCNDNTNTDILIKTSKYDHNKKTELAKKINKIKKKEYLLNIFKIITTSSKDYTENTNGVFIFFHNLEDEVYEKLESYVNNIYKLHKKNSSLKSILTSELSDSMINFSESINDDNIGEETLSVKQDNTQNIKNDMGKHLSNKEKMIIKRKKYEEYLTQNQST
jgi:hypothetical protein